METVHVIVEDYNDYIQDRNRALKLTFKTMWYIVLAFLIYSAIKDFFKASPDIPVYLGFIAFVLFLFAELATRGRIKSYVKLFLGCVYLLFAVLFGITTIIVFTTIPPELRASQVIVAAIITIVFLYAGYRNIHKYSNIIGVIVGKITRR
ncbi:MAG TPA: hypothetical protein VI977_05150 [archaeon]|nr:hypothetical protein [archaeon]